MGLLARTFSLAGRSSSRWFQTTAAASFTPLPPTPADSSAPRSPPPLLSRLLREPESGVKIALESEEEARDLATGRDGDALFWEPLLVALRSSSPKKANLVLEWKLEKMLEEDVWEHQHFSSLIALCAKLKDLPFAWRVFAAMESQGISLNTTVFNALINACMSSSNVVNALSLFEVMAQREECTPDLSTYNAFVTMYSKWGDDKGVLGWYSAAKLAGFSPDIQTYEALIMGFTRAGKFEDVSQYFEEMLSSGIIPNAAILECVLEGLCRQQKLGEAKEFWKFLLDGGWEVKEGMVQKILGLYVELKRVEEMEELLEALQQKQNTSVLMSQVHCGIIRMYARLDRLDDVEYSVGRMLKAGMLFTSSMVMEVVISCYFRCKAYERLDLFLERVRASCELTKSTYDLLIAGYRRVGLLERLELVKKDMKNRGLA